MSLSAHLSKVDSFENPHKRKTIIIIQATGKERNLWDKLRRSGERTLQFSMEDMRPDQIRLVIADEIANSPDAKVG